MKLVKGLVFVLFSSVALSSTTIPNLVLSNPVSQRTSYLPPRAICKKFDRTSIVIAYPRIYRGLTSKYAYSIDTIQKGILQSYSFDSISSVERDQQELYKPYRYPKIEKGGIFYKIKIMFRESTPFESQPATFLRVQSGKNIMLVGVDQYNINIPKIVNLSDCQQIQFSSPNYNY